MRILSNKNFWLIILLAAILTVSLAFFADQAINSIGFVLAALILIVVFFRFTEFGLYLIALLYPFSYFEFVYGSINLPYADLLAMIVFSSWLLKLGYNYLVKNEKIRLANFPALFFMFLFVLAGALSLLNVDKDFLMLAIKYLFRPIIFFYLMYLVLPYNVLDGLTKLFNVFKLMFITGLGVSLMGVWSLIFPPFYGLRRAVPIAIFGVYPAGSNHNLLAEILICIIPVALILFWYEKNIFWKNVYLLGAFLMIGINLLTLSRSGWIAFALQMIILIIFKYWQQAKQAVTSYLIYPIIFLLLPVIYLMYQLYQSGIMSSSDLNRLKLIEVAMILFNENPILGAGVGTYPNFLAQIKWYQIEYGGVLDAHGFIFKTLSETGLFGTISFILLLGYVFFLIYKGYNKYKKTPAALLLLGVLLMAAGGIIFQLFGTSYYLAKLWLPLGLALTAVKLVKENKKLQFT